MQDKYEDLSGRVFGKRVVQWPVGRKSGKIMWLCSCSCGKLSILDRCGLIAGNSDYCKSCARTKHGQARTLEYKMWGAAKHRAKKDGISFNITFQDIVIPDVCPLLKITLARRKGSGTNHESPTLDRIIPDLGYTKGNIRVISSKANVMKSDASINEMRLLLKNWEQSI